MTWLGHLSLHYRRDGARTVAHDRHDGPLRVLAALYPEGPTVCHHVLVHPPGGIVGGDRLDVAITLDAEAHALLTTPGAGRFYRSAGPWAEQRIAATVGARARLEWLPLETIAYTGARARNHVSFELADGAEMLGWDVLALGLPTAGQPFDRGEVRQRLEWPGRWLEQARIEAQDELLLDSPLGWHGHRVLGTAWFAAMPGFERARREALLEAARAATAGDPLESDAGVTSPDEGLIVLRVLGPRTEPVLRLLAAVRTAWRRAGWNLEPNPPRIWRT